MCQIRHIVRLSSLVFIILFTTSASADIICGRVIDAETHDGVPYATLSCVLSLDEYGMTMQDYIADSLGCFSFFSKGDGQIIAAMIGYKDSETISFSAFSESRKDTVDVGDIKLEPSAILLNELEVIAKAKRFTIRGDTILFHPEAFHLEEGARLQELIEQLPGVSVNENGLSWNGRPVKVVMNGKDIFGGSAIIKNLPAETVETIKAYDKASELSKRTGKDDGDKDMVLDLKIKPGFLDRFYGDAKARYQNPKQYEGEFIANRLSDNDPIMIYGEANNMNCSAVQSISSWMARPHSDGFGKGQVGAVGYQHNWNAQHGHHLMKNHVEMTASISHEDRWGKNYRETFNYFPNAVSNHLSEQKHHNNHSIIPYFNGGGRWEIDTLNIAYVNFSTEYVYQNSDIKEQTNQFALTDSMSGIIDEMIMMNNTQQHSTGNNVKINTAAGWTHFFKDGSISIDGQWDLTSKGHTELTQREVIYFTDVTNNYTLHQDNHQQLIHHNTNIKTEAKLWLGRKILLTADYTLFISRYHDDRDLMTDGLMDAANTYKDRHRNISHALNFCTTLNLRPFQLIPKMTFTQVNERECYIRGELDTLAQREKQQLEPSLNAKWKINKTSELSLDYGYKVYEPKLIQTLTYRDATNPLYIIEGNPKLRRIHVNHASLRYHTILQPQQLQFSFNTGFHLADRAHTPRLFYNNRLLSYLSRQENVRGHRELNLMADYDQGFGKILRLRNALYFILSKDYAYLLQTTASDNSQLNRQWRTYLRDNFRLSIDWKWLKTSIYGNLCVQNLYNSSAQVQNTTLWQNKMGVEAELRKGKFTVKTDMHDQMRRGYHVAEMNSDSFIWNAMIQWRCMHNKGKLFIELDDILNNADNFTSTETANQQVMSWSNQIHHYIRIGFTFNLDAKQKNKR